MNDGDSPRVPPRFVPTLTEVVVAGDVQASAGEGFAAGETRLSEEALVRRVMQRVQVDLEQRLRETVAQVVLEHTRSLSPALVVEVQSVVRSLVAQALAQERGA